MKVALALGLLVLAFTACSGRRLPPGTPPPEYEPPQVTPWPPQSADAGAEANALNPREETDSASPAIGEPELSLDAGPR